MVKIKKIVTILAVSFHLIVALPHIADAKSSRYGLIISAINYDEEKELAKITGSYVNKIYDKWNDYIPENNIFVLSDNYLTDLINKREGEANDREIDAVFKEIQKRGDVDFLYIYYVGHGEQRKVKDRYVLWLNDRTGSGIINLRSEIDRKVLLLKAKHSNLKSFFFIESCHNRSTIGIQTNNDAPTNFSIPSGPHAVVFTGAHKGNERKVEKGLTPPLTNSLEKNFGKHNLLFDFLEKYKETPNGKENKGEKPPEPEINTSIVKYHEFPFVDKRFPFLDISSITVSFILSDKIKDTGDAVVVEDKNENFSRFTLQSNIPKISHLECGTTLKVNIDNPDYSSLWDEDNNEIVTDNKITLDKCDGKVRHFVVKEKSIEKATIKPVAFIAKTGQKFKVGDRVQLDGSLSWDGYNDGNGLIYKWSITESPKGSKVYLNNVHGGITSFIPDKEGTYVISLVVNDGTEDSKPGEVEVNVAKKIPKSKINWKIWGAPAIAVGAFAVDFIIDMIIGPQDPGEDNTGSATVSW